MVKKPVTGKSISSAYPQTPRYTICISGAAETGYCSLDANKKAERLGKAIAHREMILVTGATTGIPYWAAKGAKDAAGIVIGLSPASSESEHAKRFELPVDYHDLIIYTGFNYSGRNLFLTRTADAIIVVCGRMGTLNEFTIAFEDDKPIGVLEGTGGTADMAKHIIEKSHRGPGKVVFDSDPEKLLEKVIELIRKEKEQHKTKTWTF